MYRKLATTITILIATLALSSCGTAPVYNVQNATVVANVSNASSSQVRKAIISAGKVLGWTIKDAGPGRLEGKLFLRTHYAKVSIPYSSESYSIIYKDSKNLEYDGTSIHRAYNGWIQNLNKNIQLQLSIL
jgi:hypothetical protein